jgi:spore maturation protein CgeB
MSQYNQSQLNKKTLNILYIGNSSLTSTSRHRADALVRLGNILQIEDPYIYFCNANKSKIKNILHFRTGYQFFQSFAADWINNVIDRHKQTQFDLIWINGGELLGNRAITNLEQLNCPKVLYMNDDPTGGRDGNRFVSLLRALPLYDLCVVVRPINISEFYDLKAKKVIRVWMSYDEVFHQPLAIPYLIPDFYRSDVAFIGTWMRKENRDYFLLHLINRGLNVSIWGDRWHKSPIWNKLQKNWRGSSLSGKDYTMAIQGAKISIGLLSKGNRDLHTRRSMEIPYAGGLLCAERTTEHLQLYQEDKEAVFWDNADECADKCLDLLTHPDKRESIRVAGMKRVLENKVGNEDICRQIISALYP